MELKLKNQIKNGLETNSAPQKRASESDPPSNSDPRTTLQTGVAEFLSLPSVCLFKIAPYLRTGETSVNPNSRTGEILACPIERSVRSHGQTSVAGFQPNVAMVHRNVPTFQLFQSFQPFSRACAWKWLKNLFFKKNNGFHLFHHGDLLNNPDEIPPT